MVQLELEVLLPIVPELVHGAGLLKLPHGTVVAQRAHPRPIYRGGADIIGGDIVVDPAGSKETLKLKYIICNAGPAQPINEDYETHNARNDEHVGVES